MAEKYDASKIKVLEGLEGIRKKFDVMELSRKLMLYKIGGKNE